MSNQDNPSVPPEPINPKSSTVPPAPIPTPVPTVTPTDLPTHLTDAEVQLLDRQNTRRQLMKTIAEKAASDSEVAELQYKNMIMQFFLQYNLTKADSIGQDGTIMRGNVNVNAVK